MPMEACPPFPQGCLTPGSVPGPLWSPPSRIERGTEGYSMRIASHSSVLEPSVMYLLCFAGKGSERRGEVGVLFQQRRDVCLVGECQQLTSCQHSCDTLFPGLRAGQTPQSPDTESWSFIGLEPGGLELTMRKPKKERR